MRLVAVPEPVTNTLLEVALIGYVISRKSR